MNKSLKAYPSDVMETEWDFLVVYSILMQEVDH